MKKKVVSYYLKRYGREQWHFGYLLKEGPKWITVTTPTGQTKVCKQSLYRINN